jgi:hypothetical protein
VSLRPLFACVAALGAAFLYATSNVLEQKKASQAPPETSMRIALLWHLARQPSWWIGIVSDVGGFALQAIALVFGSLIFVQPLLVMSLLFSLTLGAAAGLHELTRRDVIYASMLIAALGVFLGVAVPSGGESIRPARAWVTPGLVMVGLIGACILLSRRTTKGPLKAALFGAAAGSTFGVSSTLLKSFSHLLDQVGIVGTLEHWEPYALGVVVAFGFLAVQSGFQAGDLRASLPALEIAEPVVASVLGVTLMHEKLHAHALGAKLAIGIAIIVMAWSGIQLAESAANDHVEEESADDVSVDPSRNGQRAIDVAARPPAAK